MKLAEALLLRADIKKKIASLRERVANNAVVQQGDKTKEDPVKLMSEAVGAMDELESLVLKINSANQTHKLADGRTLAQLIARRDTLVQQHSLLQLAVASGKKEPERYSLKEIKWITTIDVAKLQKQSEDLSKKIRELNGKIQETNWLVEIK